MSDYTDIRELFSNYSRGDISAEQLLLLEAALREDADLRNEFIEYLNVDSGLGHLAALSRGEREQVEALYRESSELLDVRRGPSRLALFSAVVAATLLLSTIVWFASSRGQAETSVATIVSQVDAALLRDGEPLNGIDLAPGRYELARGLVHVRFGNGVMVYVEAPAEFFAVSDRRVLLQSGRLSASVPPEGIGFAVQTPEAEVIDFGTEFSIDVEPGSSEVHVFKGLVRVHPGASNQRDDSRSVDLRESQAVRIAGEAAVPMDISIATDRFIRNFDEPKWNYARFVKRLSPLAYYRMAIRDRGLVSDSSEYPGVVLTGEGKRPPHAQGVFAGGALRVGADSTGRGGRVDLPPALNTGQFSLAAFVYLESISQSGMIATNLHDGRGNFGLGVDTNGMLHANIRSTNGDVCEVAGDVALPLNTWRHVVVTVNGEQLQLYEDGRLVASAPCAAMKSSEAEPVWFGTDANATHVWDGRIDELALFDRALSAEDIMTLYQTAQEEMARSQ